MVDLEREPVRIERDKVVPTRDGTRLFANVFRSPSAQARPVVMSVTPYGKDKAPDRLTSWFMRLAGVRFGDISVSRWTSFEAPDPVYWVNQGYAVVQADARGMHTSEGRGGILRRRDAEDYYDLIEWAARQSWCSGRVGLMGVSYLAMSQWAVASLRPPHLSAIVPWEGVSDLYRELAFHGGIPETRFVPTWVRIRIRGGRNRRFPLDEDFLGDRSRHPMDDAFWASKRPALENIDVPALVCANWSDHGLHTRGSIEGFERISSRQKWLFTHGRRKWETFYGAEALAYQKRFLDHFLLGIDNGQADVPRVRLEVRTAYYQQIVRGEPVWPLPTVRAERLYLCPGRGTLERVLPRTEERAQYLSTAKDGQARFSLRFDQPTELIGGMRLKLWISTSEGDDLDLFVVLRKRSADGREVHFSGYNGFARDAVAKGWLRASHRGLDASRSTPLRPWHSHRVVEKVLPGQVTPLEIEVWPSATSFEAGTSLELCVLGHDADRYPAFGHRRLVNRGLHTLYSGGAFDSHLILPLNVSIGGGATASAGGGRLGSAN